VKLQVAARSPPAATRCASRGGEGLQAVGRTMRRRRSAGAALVTFRQVLPEMPDKEAEHEVMHAIAYAAANHTK
jgi:hypothetical protein